MRTNIEIDDMLMATAMRVFGSRTKREAVETGLRESIMVRQQEALMGLWGLGWEGDLDDMRTDKPRAGSE